MPRIKTVIRHQIIRDDMLAAASFAERVVIMTSKYVPPTILFVYTLNRILEPIPVLRNNVRTNPWDETKARLLAIQTPFITLLAIMYQGPLGGIAVSVASVLATLVAPFRFTTMKDAAGVDVEYRLDMLDAAFAAGMLPLIVSTLTAEPKEKAGIL
jgi:hypothetical protein